MMMAMMITTLLLTKTEIPSNVNMMHEVRLLIMQFAKDDDVGIMMVRSNMFVNLRRRTFEITIAVTNTHHHHHSHRHNQAPLSSPSSSSRVCFYARANAVSVVFDRQHAIVLSPWQSRNSRKCAWAEAICSRHASSIARVVRM